MTPISLRLPALVAKQVATVDRLSGGRIDFGIGTGWSAGSYGAIDAGFGDPGSRKARLREGIELILRLWTEDRVTMAGRPLLRRERGGGAHAAAGAASAAVGRRLAEEHAAHRRWAGLVLDPWNRPVEFYATCLREICARAFELDRAEAITYATSMLVMPADADLAMVHGDQENVTRSRIARTAEA